jgi:SAM-dependent methyltransferase
MSDQPAQATYIHGHHESVLRSHAWRTADNSAAYLLPHLRDGLRLLDVGCGPGTITIDLAKRFAFDLAVGVDVSEPVLEGARKEAEAQGADVRFGYADVSRLPFPEGSFDVVHAHQLLQHLADPVSALREMGRVCKPGGIVAARDADYAAMTWYPADPDLDDWLDLYHRVATAGGGQPDAGRRLLAWANAAGFGEVTASASTWCFATPADRGWWGETWAERMTHSELARQALDGGHADREELVRLANAWRRWAGHADAWFAVLHGEILCRTPVGAPG